MTWMVCFVEENKAISDIVDSITEIGLSQQQQTDYESISACHGL